MYRWDGLSPYCIDDLYTYRYSNKKGEASVDLDYVDMNDGDESEPLKLSNTDKESYASLFASVLVSHTNIVKDECIGQGEVWFMLLSYEIHSPKFMQMLSKNLCLGAFGKVYKGELLHSQGSGKKLVQTVAIKTIKSEL